MNMRRPKRKTTPILMGAPSPSLAKMKKMTMEEVAAQIEILTTEAARLSRKIEHLKIQNPIPQSRIDGLTEQIERLVVLQKTARDRLAIRQERAAAEGDRSNR